MKDNLAPVFCAIYARYSSEQQRDSFSIDMQLRECKSFAEKNGWKVREIYVDEAKSGFTSADGRDAFQRMFADVIKKPPPFQAVLVHKSDRFARNREDAIKYKAILKQNGVKFWSATEGIGRGDITEVILEGMLDSIAEFYSLQLKQRVASGMAEAARRGYFTGGHKPYGYTTEQIQTDRGLKQKLVIHEAEAKVVRDIFKRYVSGQGAGVICHYLNQNGFKTRTGYMWTRNVILYMLKLERYCGDSIFGRTVEASRDGFQPIVVRGAHPAIIDRKTFDRAQELMKQRETKAEVSPVRVSDYLFSGVLWCALCGGRFVGESGKSHTGKLYRYYVCGRINRSGSTACKQPKFNAARFEEVILDHVQEHIKKPDFILARIREFSKMAASMAGQHEKRAQKVRAAIQQLDIKRNRLIQAVADGVGISQADIEPTMRDLTAQKALQQLELANLERLAAYQPIKPSRAEIQAWVGCFVDILKGGNKVQVQSFVSKVVVGSESVEVTYNPELTKAKDQILMGKTGGRGRVRPTREWLGKSNSTRTFESMSQAVGVQVFRVPLESFTQRSLARLL